VDILVYLVAIAAALFLALLLWRLMASDGATPVDTDDNADDTTRYIADKNDVDHNHHSGGGA
jgi:hypothetical protein